MAPRHVRTIALAIALALLPVAAGAARAQPATDPDWPCPQRYVPEISSGQVWAGPPLLGDVHGDWHEDPALAALVPKLASRDTSADEADADAKAYVLALPEAERAGGSALLFKGVLETVNGERSELLRGIRRFAEGQQKLAKRISGENDTSAPPAEANQRVWDMRVYDERQHSLYQLCNQPVLLEQRAFQLGRTIQDLLGG